MSEWTQEELLQQAAGNGIGVMFTTIAYLKQQGLSITEWASAIGQMFAPGWDELNGAAALDIARAAAINPVSLSGSLVSLSGGDEQATAVVDWPVEESASGLGLTLDEVNDTVMGIYGSIMAHLGINYKQSRSGERWTLELFYG